MIEHSEGLQGGSILFELFYLKYACQYYGMTMQLSSATKIVYALDGELRKISAHLGGGGVHDFFYHHGTFQTVPPPNILTITVNNSLTYDHAIEVSNKIVYALDGELRKISARLGGGCMISFTIAEHFKFPPPTSRP